VQTDKYSWYDTVAENNIANNYLLKVYNEIKGVRVRCRKKGREFCLPVIIHNENLIYTGIVIIKHAENITHWCLDINESQDYWIILIGSFSI